MSIDHHRDSHPLDSLGEPAGMRISLLGGFTVSLSSRTLTRQDWSRRKAVSLVAVLALSPGYRLHREQVQEILWPALPPRAAANNLHRTLHAARRTLEPGLDSARRSRYLHLERSRLSLGGTGPITVDVYEFYRAAERALHTASLEQYERALMLYTGDLLPDDGDEDWIAAHRQELRNQYSELGHGLAHLHETAGNFLAAIDTLQRLLAHEPIDEAAHVTLMRLYALAGNRQEALRQYERLRDVLWRELETEPNPASEQLRANILSGQLFVAGSAGDVVLSVLRSPQSASAIPHNLPRQHAGLIGRERATEEVLAHLRTTRLLTLVGAGGSGKTRLALHVAVLLLPEYPDGAWLVDLAPVSDPEVVPHAVASALGLHEQPDQPIVDTLTAYLAERNLLLLLDNCEHVAIACGDLVTALLDAAPRVRVLATSRVPLHVVQEVSWRVPPLAIPNWDKAGDVEQLGDVASVALFVERARQRRADFVLSEHNAHAVVAIVRQLDGLPLAIELAAARISVLTVEQIAERLDDALTLLATSDTSVPPKHRTLRATLDWSFTLLDDAEQALFRRLAVFNGGATIEAVEAVCTGDGVPTGDVLDLLTELVEQSLLLVEERHDQARYRMLEPVRQYAATHLQDAGEWAMLHDRHLEWCLVLAAAAHPERSRGDQALWLDRLQIEFDNLSGALRWCRQAAARTESGLRLATLLWRFWSVRGLATQGRGWLETFLDGDDGASLSIRAQALLAAGTLACDQGDYARAGSLLEDGLRLFQALGDPLGTAHALNALGTCACFQCNYDRATALYEESLALFGELSERTGCADVLTNLGRVAVDRGEYSRASAYHEASLAMRRTGDDERGIAQALTNLGDAVCEQGDFARATALYDESLSRYRLLDDKHGIALTLNNLGKAARALGDYPRARALSEQALVLRREIGNRRGIAASLGSLSWIAFLEGDWHRCAELQAESLPIHLALGDKRPIVGSVMRMAQAATAHGWYERAARLFGAADALSRSIGATGAPEFHRPWYERDLATARAAVALDTFASMWREGEALSWEQAAAEALEIGAMIQSATISTSHPTLSDTPGTLTLTRRERQISELLGRGLSNREIAVELDVGLRTVESHVHRLLRKLRVRSRAEVASWLATQEPVGPSGR